MPEWEPPLWRQQGRSGPNGPKYSKRSDRNAVRRGGSPGDGKGCAVAALALAGSALILLSSAAYLAVSIGRALI